MQACISHAKGLSLLDCFSDRQPLLSFQSVALGPWFSVSTRVLFVLWCLSFLAHVSFVYRKLRGFLSDDGFHESRSALGVGDPGLCAD